MSRPSTRTEPHTKAAALRSFDEDHELNNVFVGVLLNTPAMEWKLSSYSRLKRNLHEVQRNAQRGGELAKRLLNRLEAMSRGDLTTRESETGVRDLNAVSCAVTDHEPRPAIRGEETAIESPGCSAPVFCVNSKKVPHTPV